MYWKTSATRPNGLRFLLVVLACWGMVVVARPLHAAQETIPPSISLQPPPAGDALYISFARPGKVDGINFDGSDILVYYQKRWFMFFDGSDVGLDGQNLNAFAILADDSILMSFTPRTLSLPEIGQVTHNDIVRFVPRNVGPLTRGRFERFLKGLNVGLSTNPEAIDAIAITPDGRLALSTNARPTLVGAAGEFSARGQDVIALTPATGLWEVYVDGQDLELTTGGENINALWIDPDDSSFYLSVRNRFTLPAFSGDGKDIFVARPDQTADFGRWQFQPHFNGAALELKINFDGLSIAVYPLGPAGFHVPRRR